MKHILFIAVVCGLTISAFGKGESVPAHKLRGLRKGQLSYDATGVNQWNKKIPKCSTKGKHFEACPTCKGSGQLRYYANGNYLGVYDCLKCGPGPVSNSPDGLIVVRGEDINAYYFPAKTTTDLEMDMTKHNNSIAGDIDLVSEDGKRISRGYLDIVLGFQYGQTINSLNFDWTYRGQKRKVQKILNYNSSGAIFKILDDNQMSLELKIVQYAPKVVKVKLVQKQKELFPANKKQEVKSKSGSDNQADVGSKESRRAKISKEVNQAKEITKRKEKSKIIW